MTLIRFNGIWYANSKPFKNLHIAIQALKG